MSKLSRYELPAPITAVSPSHADRLRPVARAFWAARHSDHSAEAAAHQAIKTIPVPVPSPAAQRAALREAAALLVRETATSEAALGPVAIALAVGAMEGTSDGSLRAQRAGQAALHGILTAAVELGPYAEVLVTAALRRAAAVPPDLVAQVIHDVRALCLR